MWELWLALAILLIVAWTAAMYLLHRPGLPEPPRLPAEPGAPPRPPRDQPADPRGLRDIRPRDRDRPSRIRTRDPREGREPPDQVPRRDLLHLPDWRVRRARRGADEDDAAARAGAPLCGRSRDERPPCAPFRVPVLLHDDGLRSARPRGRRGA